MLGHLWRCSKGWPLCQILSKDLCQIIRKVTIFVIPCSSQDCNITSFPDQFMGWSRGGHSAENRHLNAERATRDRSRQLARPYLDRSTRASEAACGIVSVVRTFVERKLSTWLRLGFTPSVIGEFFQIISQISVSSFARERGLLAQCFRRSSSQPFSDQGL